MTKRKLIKRQIELLRISLDLFETDASFDNITLYNSAYFDCFYKDDLLLKEEFVESIPVYFVSHARDILDFLRSISGRSNYTYFASIRDLAFSKDYIISIIDSLIKFLNNEIKDITSNTVFYSWQSNLSHKTNRYFIEECINEAIKEVNKNSDIKLVLDADTRNVPGSPDIVTTILDKIDDSAIFVGDVSLLERKSETDKMQCNQNVMFEAGYALKSLSYERIVLVCNTINGELKDLPFDLGLKRVIDYQLSENDSSESKRVAKNKLVNELTVAFKSILHRLDD